MRKYLKVKESTFVDKNDIYINAKYKKCLEDQRRKIYYPKSFEFSGYDAEGFPILGYPDDDTIQKSIKSLLIVPLSHYFCLPHS